MMRVKTPLEAGSPVCGRVEQEGCGTVRVPVWGCDHTALITNTWPQDGAAHSIIFVP
jgi:hypothetical protein